VRRSKVRYRALMMLNSLGEAYLSQLADAVGVQPTRLRWVMHGHLPAYDPELSLVPIGFVEESRDGRYRLYRITARGRRKARSLAKRRRRT